MYNLRRRFHKSGLSKYVDLGLPSGTIWATTNIGAKTPYEEGLYFAWGERIGYEKSQIGTDKMFSWQSATNDYQFGPHNDNVLQSFGMTKYNTDANDKIPTLNLENDAAASRCGQQWCLPTKEQFDELLDDRYVTKTFDSAKHVLIITSKINGEELILFAGGYGDEGSVKTYNNKGAYWSRSLNTDQVDESWYLKFTDQQIETDLECRYMGLCIRPVKAQVLTFTATQDNSTIQINNFYSSSLSFYYSINGGKSYTYYRMRKESYNHYTGDVLNLNNGDTVKFRGVNTRLGNNGDNCTKFIMTGRFEASGDVTSLLNGIGGDARLYSATFWGLFKYCAALTKAPKLPAKIAFSSCYAEMFMDCTSLTQAPELQSTELSIQCYLGMFKGCISLVTPPELPATTLPTIAYKDMFYGCTSLTKAPELPATTLASECYDQMFYGCSSLNYIKALFTTTPSNTYTRDWVKYVSANGKFIKNVDASWDVVGTEGVPEGWVADYDAKNCLTIKCVEDIDNTRLYIHKQVGSFPNLQYSLDNGDTWITYTEDYTIRLQKNQTVKFRGINDYLSDFSNNFIRACSFHMVGGKFEASGDVTSLLNNKGGDCDLVYNYTFSYLFTACGNLITAPNLPSTTLSKSCYEGMFYQCTGLTKTPVLPATTLVNSCYKVMFKGCTQLNNVTCLATDKSATNCTDRWLQDVSQTGTFVQAQGVQWETGNSGIPSGWTIQTATE